MKILILLSHTPNPRAMKRINLLHGSGKQLFLVCARRKKNLNFIYHLPEGVNVKEIMYNDSHFLLRLFSLLRFILIALREIAKFRPETIHLTNLDMLLCASVYKKVFNRKVKIVYEVADIPEMIITRDETFATRGIKKIEASLCKNIHRLILTSPKYFDAYYFNFVPKEKMFFMPNVPSRQTFAQYRKKGYNVGEFTIGFIGFIRYLEVLKVLIEAVGETPESKLLIAGDGMDAPALRDYVKDKGIENVIFSGAYDYSKDIANLYGKVDLIYSAYDNESKNSQLAIPNRLYESIVCELPIIVAENTYLAEVVAGLSVGLSVNPYDKSEVGACIEKIRTSEFYQKLSKKCNEIKDNYYLEEYNEELISIYNVNDC